MAQFIKLNVWASYIRDREYEEIYLNADSIIKITEHQNDVRYSAIVACEDIEYTVKETPEEILAQLK